MIRYNSMGNPISNEFVSALTNDNRTYRARILMDGSELECAITRLTITKGSCANEEAFTIGSVVGTMLTAEVKGLEESVKGRELEVQIGLLVNDAFEYVTMGYFTVSEAPQTVYAATITAYGAVVTRTGSAFIVPESQTLSNIALSIATSVSALAGRTVTVSFDPSIITSKMVTASLNGITVYQALQILASVCGGFATDTNDGNIRIRRFSTTPTLSRDTASMRSLPVTEEEDFEIKGVLCTVKEESEDEEGTVIPAVRYPLSPTGEENLVLSNQYITQDLYDSFLATLIGYGYRPATIGLTYGDPRLEGDDVLSVTDVNGSEYMVPCHMLTHTFDGGFSSQVISASATPQENNVGSSGDSITERLSDISASVISARASAESAKISAETAKSQASAATGYANEAKQQAQAAATQAQEANRQASAAAGSADEAKRQAQSAEQSAGQALEQAQTATKYANGALDQLGVVQDVIGVLTWASEHGTFTRTQDTTVQDGKVYFTYDSQTGDYTPVVIPQESALSTYYELTVDEAMQSFIMAHLAVTARGLWVLPNGINTGSVTPASGETMDDARARLGAEYKVLLANDGMHVYDGAGVEVSLFGENIRFNATRPQYIGGEDAHIVFDSADGSITIGGEYVTMISPESVFLWDLVLTVLEREAANEGLDISEDVSTWVYDDLSHAEMEEISEELDIAESTTAWQTSVSVSEYKVLCDGLGIGYQFGRSVYVGMDAISLGDNFFVDPSGYLISSSGKIAGWDINENALSHGIEGTTDYVELSGEKGIKLGKWFEITPSGVIRARRGIFAGFTMVPVNNGNDYLMSDYETNGVTWRTWIRSAQDKDKGGTWAFSSQYKRNGEDDFFGAFVARSNGELTSLPVDDNGVPLGHAFEVDSNGIYLYPNNTVTSQPNIYWNPSNGYLAYTTWNSSSEKLKKNIKSVTKKAILPENLYDVKIVQFQYKDDVVNKNDQRFGEDLIGFVIEDLDRRYPVAVDKADEKDSTTWAWNSAYLIPAMLKLIQNQHSEIDLLKERQEALEKDIAKIMSILKGDNMT